MTTTSKTGRFSATTEEGRVLQENLLHPDTPERRKRFQQYARGQYRLTIGLPLANPAVVAWAKKLTADLTKFMKQEIPKLGEQDIAAAIRRRIKKGDDMIARAQERIADGEQVRVPTECAGLLVITAGSKSPPVVVDANERPLEDKDVYRGMWGIAGLTFFAYRGNDTLPPGLGCWVNAFVKTRDDAKLGRAADLSPLLQLARAKVAVPVTDNSDDDEDAPF